MSKKGNNTTTQQSAPSPQAMQAYQDLLARAGGVSQTPYQGYTGEMVAPINAQQTAGISNINQNAGFAQPYIQQAAGYATQAANPITGAQIQQYQDPYTQQVVDATMAQFANQNAQQQQGVLGNAAAQGALGGDRVGVAQANLAGQQTLAQAPVIAGLYSKGYSQALQAAQQQQQNLGQAAYSLGNLGVAGQNAALTGANAQIGAGTLQQGTQQAQNAAAQQEFMRQQAYPFQTTQWLAGIDTGVGSQMGGTSTTTAPAPSVLGQIAGAGLAGFGLLGGSGAFGKSGWLPGMFSSRGGAIQKYDLGGGVASIPYSGVTGYVPSYEIARGRGAPSPPSSGGGQSSDASKIVKDAIGLAKTFRYNGVAGPTNINSIGFSPSGVGDIGSSGISLSGGLPSIYAHGGFVDLEPSGIYLPRNYDDGGIVPSFDDRFSAAYPEARVRSFADRVAPVQQAISEDVFDQQGDNYTRYLPPSPTLMADVPLPRSRPGIVGEPESLPPEIMAGVSAPAPGVVPSGDIALGYDSSGAGAPTAGLSAPAPVAPTTPDADARGFGFSPAGWAGITAAGLGMLASRSPHPGVAIGEGGLQGIQAYGTERRAEQEAKKSEATIEHGRKQLELAAKKAADDLSFRTKELAQRKEMHESMTPYQRATLDQQAQIRRDELEEKRLARTKPIVVDKALVDPVTGKALYKGASGLLDDDTIKDMAGQYVAGDRTVMQNLGRGAQGAENIVKLRKAISDHMKSEGISPYEQATRMAEFEGQKAGQRALGTRTAQVEMFAGETMKMLDVAEQLSDKVYRTRFVPVNQALQAFERRTGDPDIQAFGAALNSLVNTYAKAISGGGQATVSDKDHAREIISAANSPEQFKAVMGVIRRELEAARAAPGMVKESFRHLYGNQQPSAAPALAAPAATMPATAPQAIPPAASRVVNTIYQTPKGPYRWLGNGWEAVAP